MPFSLAFYSYSFVDHVMLAIMYFWLCLDPGEILSSVTPVLDWPLKYMAVLNYLFTVLKKPTYLFYLTDQTLDTFSVQRCNPSLFYLLTYLLSYSITHLLKIIASFLLTVCGYRIYRRMSSSSGQDAPPAVQSSLKVCSQFSRQHLLRVFSECYCTAANTVMSEFNCR